MHRTALLLAAALLPPAAQAQAAPTVPCALPGGALPTRTRAVFVLDTSGSMRGLGDGRANIFQGVKGSVNTYVRTHRPDRVELLTFDSGVRSRQSFEQPAGTPAWNAALGALHADGQNTHLYRSLRAALTPLQGADEYVTTVFVLTDGIDNDPQRPYTPTQALAAFTGRGPLDRLHYVALGTGIPEDAQRALRASPYADGLTLPVGTLPDLSGAGLEGGVVTVTDAARVPVPFPDGTPLTLATGTADAPLTLTRPAVQAGHAALTVRGAVPYGQAALLCAPGDTDVPGSVASKPRRVLLRLNVGTAPALVWLNPGADLHLKAGEDVVLRYRAAPGVTLSGARVEVLGMGVDAQLERQPGARAFAVRLTNLGLPAGQTVNAQLVLPGVAARPLPAVTAQPGGRVPTARPAAAPARQTSLQGRSRFPRRLAWLLLGLLVLVAAALAFRRVRRRNRQPPLLPPAPDSVPTVDGIEYSEDRTLSLVGQQGRLLAVPTPLGGPFDLGQLSRAPLLSGLRAQQHRDGLKLLKLPADLEVSQGARLLLPGDVVRPGTLLGVVVARRDRAQHPPLGTLQGLGLPLSLRCQDVTLRVNGPYGEHVLHLPPGVTDLGRAFRAPALAGLKFSASGMRILIVEVPAPLTLRRTGENVPLRPGTYLPAVTLIDLPDT